MRKNVLINVNVTAMRIDLKERFFRPLISDCTKIVAVIKSTEFNIGNCCGKSDLREFFAAIKCIRILSLGKEDYPFWQRMERAEQETQRRPVRKRLPIVPLRMSWF